MDPHTRSSGHQRLPESRQLPKPALLYCQNMHFIVGATTLLSCRGPPTSQCIEWTVTNGVELTTHMKISQSMKRHEAPFFKLTAQAELEVRRAETKIGGTVNDHLWYTRSVLVMRLDMAHIEPLVSAGAKRFQTHKFLGDMGRRLARHFVR